MFTVNRPVLGRAAVCSIEDQNNPLPRVGWTRLGKSLEYRPESARAAPVRSEVWDRHGRLSSSRRTWQRRDSRCDEQWLLSRGAVGLSRGVPALARDASFLGRAP